MSLYLGNQLITSINTDVTSWWGGHNPLLLYETTYQCKLSETNYSSLTISTSAQALTQPATTYTASGSGLQYPTIDRWGTNYHSGSALDLGHYDYVMVEDYIADIKYTGNEATMGSIHGIKMTHERILNICPTIRMSSNTIIQPTETTYGTGVVSGYGSESMYWYRNASNNQAIARNISYCFYFSGTGPSLSATNVVEVPYINIRASQINVRANNNYMPLANFDYVDADNTIFKMRFRLYQVDKRILSDYAINNNLVYMYENNTFPTGIY